MEPTHDERHANRGGVNAVNWARWRNFDYLLFEECVALSLGLEPEQMKHIDDSEEFRDRLDTALRFARRKETRKRLGFEPDDPPGQGRVSEVSVLAFVRFATEMGWPMPEEFRAMGSRSAKGRLWPWGAYETALLRIMIEAAEEHWVNFDPNKPKTAPKKTYIVQRLRQTHGLTLNEASAIDMVLRYRKIPNDQRG